MLLNLPNYYVVPILFSTGVFAGMVDAIAGGGGLITVPVLMGVGVPVHVALGTNKLQAIVGTTLATYSYYRNGLISFVRVYQGLIFGFFGSALGSLVGQWLDGEILKKIIPLFLSVILVYVLFSPKIGMEENKPRFREWIFYTLFGFVLGFYDGFFGPGTGSFWIFSLTFFLGYTLTSATAYTKLLNLNSNLIATVCFAFAHNIAYDLAFFMAVGQIIGSQLGVYIAMRKGVKIVRLIFIMVVSMTIISLAWKH